MTSAARLTSIQRLGGLKLPSSRDALHGVIENGNDAESKWAVYAALRTGDVSVLPRVKRLLATGDGALPESAIALQLQSVTDPWAVPDLIAILESAPSELTRSRVLIALGEKLKDPLAVPSLAAHLSDPDRYARYDALDVSRTSLMKTLVHCLANGRRRCRTANIALQALVGKGRQVSRLVPKLGQSAANRGPRYPTHMRGTWGRWARSGLVALPTMGSGPISLVR